MKKQETSEFGETYSQRQITAMARWEKLQADGKWLWIFKRGAIWVTLILFLYGLGALAYPEMFNFERFQGFILLGMFGGFIISSLMEWSKMEAIHHQNKIK